MMRNLVVKRGIGVEEMEALILREKRSSNLLVRFTDP